MLKALTILALLAPVPAAAASTIITGPARIIDGDTVVVGATHVRLKGVDAAEMNTELGRRSRQVMQDIVGRSNLTCELTGEKTYKRDVGFCETDDGVDIARAIIERGAALACPRYDTRYVKYESPKALDTLPRAKYCGRPQHAPQETAMVSAIDITPLPAPRPTAIGFSETHYCADEPNFKGCTSRAMQELADAENKKPPNNHVFLWLAMWWIGCLMVGKRWPTLGWILAAAPLALLLMACSFNRRGCRGGWYRDRGW